jgi:aspartyl-tRNA(Asn)/glutamyl-tRNA(Gln) amidotransferase subunit A
LIAFASSLDTPGPFARTAEDCALLLNAMAGHDARDSTSLERPREDYTRDLAQPLAGLRIGLPSEYFGDGIDRDVAAAVDAAIAQFKKLGAATVEIALPAVRLSVPVYYVIAPAEGVVEPVAFRRRPLRPSRCALHRPARHVQEVARGGLRRRGEAPILVGTYVLSHGYYDAYYLKAQQVRRLIADDFRRAFEQCDVIAGPTAPSAAFRSAPRATIRCRCT